MNPIDELAVKAKIDNRCLEVLIRKVEFRLTQKSMKFPYCVKLLFDQDGDLKWLVWELVKKYNYKEGGFIGFLNSNVQYLVKSEYRKWKKFNTRGIDIYKDNMRFFRESGNFTDYLADKESFYIACKELIEHLTERASRIFKERVYPSKRTIRISVRAAFKRGGSDSPVRLRWKHIAKSLRMSYVRVINTVNQEIFPKAFVIFRKYGFHNPYEYRDGIPEKMKNFSVNFPSQEDH